MTIVEAIEKIEAGEKVTHRFFSPDEFVQLSQCGNYIFEDGYMVRPSVFLNDRNGEQWQDGWSIFGSAETNLNLTNDKRPKTFVSDQQS